MITKNSALLIIDVQKGLDDPKLGQRNNPEAEANMARLLARWREDKRPLIHIKHNSTDPHSPLRPELPGNAIKKEVAPLPDEPLFEKSVNSGFVNTGLNDFLQKRGIDSLVVVGLTTPHCVSTTVRNASDLGYDVTLIADATAAHAHTAFDGKRYDAETIHTLSLVSLDGEFCRVLSTQALLDELKSAKGGSI